MLTRTPKQGYLAACGALKRADLRPAAGLIEAPTLCLVGDQDGSTPVRPCATNRSVDQRLAV